MHCHSLKDSEDWLDKGPARVLQANQPETAECTVGASSLRAGSRWWSESLREAEAAEGSDRGFRLNPDSEERFVTRNKASKSGGAFTAAGSPASGRAATTRRQGPATSREPLCDGRNP
jgi:hypothetical protein